MIFAIYYTYSTGLMEEMKKDLIFSFHSLSSSLSPLLSLTHSNKREKKGAILIKI